MSNKKYCIKLHVCRDVFRCRISLLYIFHLSFIFWSISKHFYSIDYELNTSYYALVDADALESKYSFFSRSIKTLKDWNADRFFWNAEFTSVFFLSFLFVLFNSFFNAFNRFFSFFCVFLIARAAARLTLLFAIICLLTTTLIFFV